MRAHHHPPIAVNRVIAVVMGGGAGTRLFPLTKDRAKPAVPLAGRYRLVDVPISNCLNSGLRKIYLLTQFNSTSLHRHVQNTYKFDHFSRGFVEIMAAQQTYNPEVGWYQGTADAVRVNLHNFDNDPYDYIAILSGDQLYRMNYLDVLSEHIRTNADITVCTIPVDREAVSGFGIMQTDSHQRITKFVEKPKDDMLQGLEINASMRHLLHHSKSEELYLASMGIYIFSRAMLHKVLHNQKVDFGRDVIPAAIEKYHVHAHLFEGYWEDIGTVGAFYRANLDLCSDRPQFDYGLESAPIYTQSKHLQPNKLKNCTLERAVLCGGLRIGNAHIRRSVLGDGTLVGNHVEIENSLIMGTDCFEGVRAEQGHVPLGIGDGSIIKNAILDKNVRVGKNCRISPEGKPDHQDHPLFYMRDGIIVIPKGVSIPDDTVL